MLKLQLHALRLVVAFLAVTASSAAIAQSDVETGLSVFPSIDLGGVAPAAGEHATFTATLERTAPHRGKLTVQAEMQPEWHIYSLTQPAGGPTPTKIELVSQPGIKLTGPLEPDQPPHITSNEAWPGLSIEQYDDAVSWYGDVELTPEFAGPVQLKVRALVCQDDGSCQPLNKTLTVKLTSAPAKVTETGAMAAETRQPEQPAPAATPFRAPGYVIEWTSHVEPATVKAGDRARLILSAKIDSGYHMYQAATDDRDFATSFVVTEKSGLLVGAPATENETVTVPSLIPGTPDEECYEDVVTWELPIQIPADAASGSKQIEGYVAYNACDANACLIPQGLKFTASLSVGDEAVTAPVQLVAHSVSEVKDLVAESQWVDKVASQSLSSSTDAAMSASRSTPESTEAEVAKPSENSATDASASAVSGAPQTTIPDELNWDQEQITSQADLSLPMAILFALIGGFILNFMPCVLPVVGLKIMAFAEQAGESRARVLWLNLWYTLGMLSVFWILAAVAIIFSRTVEGTFSWGQQFTYIQFRLGMIILVFAMALSFLGVWEIPIPGFVGGNTTQKLQRKEGSSGAFFKGIFTTLLATPCSGPLLGPVFGFMLNKESYLVVMIFTAIGLGMAMPYLLVALFPRLIAFLPKPGAWMDTFKQLLAFLLLGTVVFLFNTFSDNHHLAVLSTLIGVWFGCWIIGQVPAWDSMDRRLFAWGGGVSAAVLVGFLSFKYLTTQPAILNWEPYTEARLQQLQREGKTVMIDFTASWCSNCHVNFKVAINTPETSKLVAELDAVPMLADMSDTNEEINRKLVELQSNSIPVLAIYPGGQATKPIVLRDVLTQSQVSKALKYAGEVRKGGRLTSTPVVGGTLAPVQ